MAIPAGLHIPTADGHKRMTAQWLRDRLALGHWPENMSPTEWQAQLGVVANGLEMLRHAGFDTAWSKTEAAAWFQSAGWLTD